MQKQTLNTSKYTHSKHKASTRQGRGKDAASMQQERGKHKANKTMEYDLRFFCSTEIVLFWKWLSCFKYIQIVAQHVCYKIYQIVQFVEVWAKDPFAHYFVHQMEDNLQFKMNWNGESNWGQVLVTLVHFKLEFKTNNLQWHRYCKPCMSITLNFI